MKKEVLLIILILTIAIFSRFILLDLRPLHNDEGVVYSFSKTIVSLGHWTYDPLNYHGPFYYYITAISFFIFGISEFSLRFPSAFFGVLIVAFVLLLYYKEESFDKSGKYYAAILIILSSSLMYYSRYSVHETVLIFFSFLCVYFLTRMIEKENLKDLVYFSISLVLAFTTKETVIILIFALFLMVLFNINKIKKIKPDYKQILISLIIFIVIYVLFFSSIFTSPIGVAESLKGFMPWISHGVNGIGHQKPFYYFLSLIAWYELPILLLGIIGLYFSFKSKNIFYKNISIWFLVMLFVYSLIPYKTPWLVINITLPLCLLSGVALVNIKSIINKKVFIILLIVSVSYLLCFGIYLNFINYYKDTNKYAYVHTDRGILDIVNQVNSQYKNNSKILIVSDDYWPLPFYFDDKTVFYFSPKDFKMEEYKNFSKEYDFMIVSEPVWSEINQTYSNTNYMVRTLNSNRVELYLIRTKN
jgi:uncharacterized protein (TIGR03663 family)